MPKGKYCCFVCPTNNWDVRDSKDLCPTCGKPFGFPLDDSPSEIGKYRIESALSRGFYGSAYLAISGRLGAKSVLKVTPVSLYRFFKKDFEAESRLHMGLADGTQHVVRIRDVTEEDVTFANGISIRCHVAELDYVNGNMLKEYLDGTIEADAAAVAQIAIDLLRMRREFELKRLYHNDLHAENLIVEKLPATMRRQDAIADTILVKAIDLGSLSDASKSGLQNRPGDLESIGTHLHELVGRLLAKPHDVGDRDYRVAMALQTIAQNLTAAPENARTPNIADLVTQIHDAYYHATQPWRPWTMPLSLKSYGDHYNALTLNSWNVPALMVDPDGAWLREVSKAGPQIIIGMRGCGKTMLLRALDFHARANPQPKSESPQKTVERLKNDRYVGLFVPAQRLLDLKEQSLITTEQRIAVLCVYFALQASRAIIHLSDLDASQVAPNAHVLLEESVFDFLRGADSFRGSSSITDLERRLEKLAVSVSRQDDPSVEIASAPAQVFTRLAENFRRCSPLWSQSQVFFLLDDVSTRYLEVDKIEKMFSVLLFSNPVCAFKFTSEWQTLELGLRSPGRINPIRIDRDVSVFDLGSVVHSIVKKRGQGRGKNFVEKILEQRATHFARHPSNQRPSRLLGDVTLEKVAQEIAGSGETSNTRKKVYRGLTCLANVCVGDIGDIIKLYEEILKAWDGTKLPIPPEVQSQCFQDISSLRLYDLNRLRVSLMRSAKAFAEASYELLVLSGKELSNGKESRLRQYSTVYVRVAPPEPAGDVTVQRLNQSEQVDRLRDLIDAGVFVFSGGSPRTKTRDSDPIHQFKLSYRKIYGLANFIGLADRDRFELSGRDLEQWLANSDSAKDILLRNQKGEIDEETESQDELDDRETEGAPLDPGQAEIAQTSRQGELSLVPALSTEAATQESLPGLPANVTVRVLDRSDLDGREFDSVFTGLGFESRAVESNRTLASLCRPQAVVCVAYPNPGERQSIMAAWRKTNATIQEVSYGDCVYRSPELGANSLVDVSGLAKPAIFHAIREQLTRFGRVTICHAAAAIYYPRQSDLEGLFAAESGQHKAEMLARLSELLKGEEGPYEPRRLLPEGGDALRKRVLLGYVSPKHERIFDLLQKREYDGIELVCGEGDDPRSRVARLAGEVLVRSHENARLVPISTNDLCRLVEHADDAFRALFGTAGAAFEVALTGSKLQAVAAAVVTATRRVAQAWYVAPKSFDAKRFSQGVGDTHFYEISAS